MTPKLIEDLGFRFPTEKSNYKARFGLYECQYCGKEWECSMQSVKTGRTKSCGCLRGGKPIHGMSSNKFYKTWHSMIYRCNNPKNKRC